MRKTLIVMVALLSMFILTGCKSRKVSKDVYDECKRAVKIMDDYLDYDITQEEAKKRFERIECNPDKDDQDDILVCAQMSLIDVMFSSFDLSDSEIKQQRSELKENCGL